MANNNGHTVPFEALPQRGRETRIKDLFRIRLMILMNIPLLMRMI